MTEGTQEIEQGFIPKTEFVKNIKSSYDQRLQIVQCYLSVENRKVTKAIRFERGEKGEAAVIDILANGKVVLSVRETGPEKIKALFGAYEATQGRFLDNARIRYQRDVDTDLEKLLYTIKGHKKNGVADEYEFEIEDKHAALYLMRDFGRGKILAKTRYVKSGVIIAGKNRVLELDEFQGAHQGKYKLEIEHGGIDDWIAANDWAAFADAEVTEDKRWSNSKMAGEDIKAFAIISF